MDIKAAGEWLKDFIHVYQNHIPGAMNAHRIEEIADFLSKQTNKIYIVRVLNPLVKDGLHNDSYWRDHEKAIERVKYLKEYAKDNEAFELYFDILIVNTQD